MDYKIKNSLGEIMDVEAKHAPIIDKHLERGNNEAIDNFYDIGHEPSNTVQIRGTDNKVQSYDVRSKEYADIYNSGNLTNYDDKTNTYIATPFKPVEVTANRQQAPEQPVTWNDVTTSLDPRNWGINDYTHAGSRNQAFGKARLRGDEKFLYNGKRYNSRKDTDNLKIVGEGGSDAADLISTEYPELEKLINRGSGIGAITFDGTSIEEATRAFYSPNKNIIGLGNDKLSIVSNLISEVAHLKDPELRNSQTHKRAIEDKEKYGEEVYNIKGTSEYKAHTLYEPGIAMTAYGNLTQNDIKRIQKHLGTEEDGYFGEKTYEALRGKYRNQLTKENKQFMVETPGLTTYNTDPILNYLKLVSKEVPLKGVPWIHKDSTGQPFYSDNALRSINPDDKDSFSTNLLQYALNSRRDKSAEIRADGIYGNETKKALIDWQAKNKKSK